MLVEIMLKLPATHKSDFREFLHRHQCVDSFQEADGCFRVKIIPQDPLELLVFMRWIKDVFPVGKVKETFLCQGICRNGTNCLNRARYGEFCFRHKRVE